MQTLTNIYQQQRTGGNDISVTNVLPTDPEHKDLADHNFLIPTGSLTRLLIRDSNSFKEF